MQPSLFLFEQMENLVSRPFYWGIYVSHRAYRAAVMGAALVMWMMAIIPYALAFAAGAMIFCGNRGIDS